MTLCNRSLPIFILLVGRKATTLTILVFVQITPVREAFADVGNGANRAEKASLTVRPGETRVLEGFVLVLVLVSSEQRLAHIIAVHELELIGGDHFVQEDIYANGQSKNKSG